MIIKLKNKDTLNIGEFKLKCCIGKKGISKKRLREIGKLLQENLKLEIYIGDLTKLKNQKQSYFVKKLKKIWAGVMILIALSIIKKLK